MKTAAEMNEGLRNFYGTENWYRFSPLFPRMLLTDGVKWLADNAECYWLLDVIGSHQPKALKDKKLRDIQFWTLTVHPDHSATVICERDSGDVAIKQEIENTGFPLPEMKLWVEPMGDGQYCIILPSEH